MKANTDMTVSEQVSMLVSALIQSDPQTKESVPALRAGESLEQAHVRAAAIRARIAAQR